MRCRHALPSCLALELLLFILLSVGAEAVAQERVPLLTSPDVDLAIATLKEDAYLDVGAGVGGAVGLPEGRENNGRAEVFVDVLAALRAARTTHVSIWSRWMLPLVAPWDGADPEVMAIGRHRARAAVGVLTTRGPRRHGFNMAVDASIHHQGAEHVGIRDARVGDGPFVMTELEAQIAPKFALGWDGDTVLLVPISYLLHDTSYTGEVPALSASPRGHGVRAGIGFQSRDSEWREGVFRIVDVRWMRVGADKPGAFAGTEHIAFDAWDVRLFSMDDVVFFSDRVFWSVDVSLGAAGFAPIAGGPDGATFAGSLGSRLRTREGGGGLTVARSAVWSADAQRALGDTSIEVEAEYKPRHDGGLRAVLGFSWLDAIDTEADLLTFRFASLLEASWDLPEDFEAGLFYVANRGMDLDDATWDPWTAAMRWDQQVGVFARWGRPLR